MERVYVEKTLVEIATSNLWSTDVIVCDVPAGSMVWNVIRDAVNLKNYTSRPVWFEFNGQLFKVGLKDTEDTVAAQWDQG